MKIKNRIGPGLMIGLPTLGRPLSLDWAMAFKALNPPINFNTVFNIVKDQEIGNARNLISGQAILQGAKYLFFLGDDVIVPPHTLRQLIFRMEQDSTLGVVGGVYCAKCDPSFPLVFRENGQGAYWDWKIGEFFEVNGLGMDCTLIRVECFHDIKPPFFQTVDKDQFLDGINKAEQWTEDLYFFEKLKNTKWKTYCDASVICEHEDIYGGKKYTLPPGSLPLRMQQITKPKNLLVIGPKVDLAKNVHEDHNITWTFDDDKADYRCQPNNLPFDENQFDWVIVTTPQNTIPDVEEWSRVLKEGGTLSINFHDFINLDVVSKRLGGTVNGSFVELIKERNARTDI